MSTFDEREQAFEAKYAHDQEMKFKAQARRNKLLGLWLAEKMGKDDPEAYAKSIVIADLAEEGVEDVIRKAMDDIREAGADISEAEVREKLVELSAVAKEQVMNEAGD